MSRRTAVVFILVALLAAVPIGLVLPAWSPWMFSAGARYSEASAAVFFYRTVESGIVLKDHPDHNQPFLDRFDVALSRTTDHAVVRLRDRYRFHVTRVIRIGEQGEVSESELGGRAFDFVRSLPSFQALARGHPVTSALESRHFWPGIAAYGLAAEFAGALNILTLVGAGLTVRNIRRMRRKLDGRCPFCGYDMTGAPTQTCPECGRASKLQQSLSSTRSS